MIPLTLTLTLTQVTAKLSEASKNALSFLSSTVAALGEKVQQVQKVNMQSSSSLRGYGGDSGEQVISLFFLCVSVFVVCLLFATCWRLYTLQCTHTRTRYTTRIPRTHTFDDAHYTCTLTI